MWNPFKKAREKREAEAKRKAAEDAAKLAEQLRRVNDALTAARTRTVFPSQSERLRVVEFDLTAQRAYRQDMQRRAIAEENARNQSSSYTSDQSTLQTQMLLNSLQTSSSDSYSPPPSCTPSHDSSSGSSSDSGSSDSGGSCGGSD
jgi:hypothetical protein